MNRRRMLALAKFLDTLPPRKFRQDAWSIDRKTGYNLGHAPSLRDCRTAGCIAGWAVARFGSAEDRRFDLGRADLIAGRLLGLTDRQVEILFFGQKENLTPKQAAKLIREVASVDPVFYRLP